jgi:Uma2 family endonuclease
MSLPAKNRFSVPEFFTFLSVSQDKWELVDGVPIMMAGATQRHQDVAANLLASLHQRLRGSGCRPTGSDTGVLTGDTSVRYPDLVVDCGPRYDDSMHATKPTVVIEVLSPSTRGFDSHLKLIEYKGNTDISQVLLVDTVTPRVLVHLQDGEVWREEILTGLKGVIDLPDVRTELPMADVYDGIDFGPRLVDGAPCERCGKNPCFCGTGLDGPGV